MSSRPYLDRPSLLNSLLQSWEEAGSKTVQVLLAGDEGAGKRTLVGQLRQKLIEQQESFCLVRVPFEAGDDSVRVASIYLPNGNPVGSEKYPYKLKWMDRLTKRASALLASEEPVVLGGDYNVIPADTDCYDPAAWANDALFKPETRAKFRTLLNLGYTEAWRTLHNETHVYSFWDYQKGAWQKDNGIRIDHLLLSPKAADRLAACEIDRAPRGKTKASDHTPVWCELRA